jgi:hypothetical protein
LAAVILGLGFTAFNVYWALGFRDWLDTVFPAADLPGLAQTLTLPLQWLAIVAKTFAALLGLAAVPAVAGRLDRRLKIGLRSLAWAAAVAIVAWGVSQSAWFWLVKLGQASMAGWTRRAVNGHAYVWDPWFLLWGVALLVALLLSRSSETPVRTRE